MIQCDATLHGAGAVLAQNNDKGKELPIAYMSQKLNQANQNYSLTERECLAPVLPIKKYKSICRRLNIYCSHADHASLRRLINQSDLNGRLSRWALKFQGFDFNIVHR